MVQGRLSVGTVLRPVTTAFPARADAARAAAGPAGAAGATDLVPRPSSLAEVPVRAEGLLAAADGTELAAWAHQHWVVDVRASPTASAWLGEQVQQDAGLRRVLDPAAAGEDRSLQLRLDVTAAVLWTARHRRAVLVEVLLARGWAEHAAAGAGVGVLAARLGVGVLPRRRTTAWRALAAVHADAGWLAAQLRSCGVRTSDAEGLGALARYVLGAGDGQVLLAPERAVAYRAAGVGAAEAAGMEAGPARPTLAVLRGLAALRG